MERKNEKTFIVSDFTASLDKAYNLSVSKEEIKDGFGIKPEYEVKTFGKDMPLAIYSLGGNVYYYADDFFIYKANTNGKRLGAISNGVLKKNMVFFSAPKSLKYVAEGKEHLVLYDDKAAYDICEDVIAPCYLPTAKLSCMHFHTLFTAEGNRLNFSSILSGDFTSGLHKGGYFDLSEADGEICGLYSVNEQLIIVTKNALYTLSAYGERKNFNLRRYDLPTKNCNYKSFKVVCGELIFVADNIYSFNGQNFKIIGNKAAKLSPDYKTMRASGYGSKYILQTKLKKYGEDLYFLILDVLSDTVTVLKKENALLFDEGLIYDIHTESLGRLTETGELFSSLKTCFYKSVKLDFGTKKDKTISKINFYSETPLTFRLKAGNKTMVYNSLGGQVELSPDFYCTDVIFEFLLIGKKAGIRDLTFKYVEQGENK